MLEKSRNKFLILINSSKNCLRAFSPENIKNKIFNLFHKKRKKKEAKGKQFVNECRLEISN